MLDQTKVFTSAASGITTGVTTGGTTGSTGVGKTASFLHWVKVVNTTIDQSIKPLILTIFIILYFNLFDKNTILKKQPLLLTNILITVKAISEYLTLFTTNFVPL